MFNYFFVNQKLSGHNRNQASWSGPVVCTSWCEIDVLMMECFNPIHKPCHYEQRQLCQAFFMQSYKLIMALLPKIFSLLPRCHY